MRALPKAQVLFSDSERSGDMLYATGVFVPDPFLFFQWKRKKYVVVGDLEFSRMKREAKVDMVFSWREFQSVDRKGSSGASKIARIYGAILKSMDIRSLEVPEDFPLRLADDFRKEGFQVQAKRGLFFPQRARKTEREVELIRSALRAAETGLKSAAEILAQSKVEKRTGDLRLGGDLLTSERLRMLIHRAILETNCQARNTIVAGGKQGFDPHCRGEGVLRAGEPIIVDIFPRCESSGYYGDMTRTFVKSSPPPQLRSMFEAVKKAQDYAISKVCSGAESHLIHKGIVELFAREGFPTAEQEGRPVGFFHGTGHGVGLELHEAPRINTKRGRLETGNVVTIEPGLYYPELGGVRLEDVVLVRSDGAQVLSRFDRFLET
ncbi:MAG: Xaa-Pro peptidase family protein [Acidobacteriota bacterium]